MRKMMTSQLKGVPQAEQDKLFAMIEKDPAFFQKIAVEVQEAMKNGKDHTPFQAKKIEFEEKDEINKAAKKNFFMCRY